MRRIWLGLPLVLVWVFLWGDASVANLLSGALVAAALLSAFPSDRPTTGRYVVRPLACLRLVVFFVVQLIKSNLSLVRQTLRPSSQIHSAVIAFPLQTTSPRLITVIMNTMALTPGSMPIELDDDPETDPSVLYVHVLYTDDVESIRHTIETLQARVIAAFAADSSSRGEDPSASPDDRVAP